MKKFFEDKGYTVKVVNIPIASDGFQHAGQAYVELRTPDEANQASRYLNNCSMFSTRLDVRRVEATKIPKFLAPSSSYEMKLLYRQGDQETKERRLEARRRERSEQPVDYAAQLRSQLRQPSAAAVAEAAMTAAATPAPPEVAPEPPEAPTAPAAPPAAARPAAPSATSSAAPAVPTAPAVPPVAARPAAPSAASSAASPAAVRAPAEANADTRSKMPAHAAAPRGPPEVFRGQGNRPLEREPSDEEMEMLCRESARHRMREIDPAIEGKFPVPSADYERNLAQRSYDWQDKARRASLRAADAKRRAEAGEVGYGEIFGIRNRSSERAAGSEYRTPAEAKAGGARGGPPAGQPRPDHHASGHSYAGMGGCACANAPPGYPSQSPHSAAWEETSQHGQAGGTCGGPPAGQPRPHHHASGYSYAGRGGCACTNAPPGYPLQSPRSAAWEEPEPLASESEDTDVALQATWQAAAGHPLQTVRIGYDGASAWGASYLHLRAGDKIRFLGKEEGGWLYGQIEETSHPGVHLPVKGWYPPGFTIRE